MDLFFDWVCNAPVLEDMWPWFWKCYREFLVGSNCHFDYFIGRRLAAGDEDKGLEAVGWFEVGLDVERVQVRLKSKVVFNKNTL